MKVEGYVGVMAGMRIAVFVGKDGVERIVPAGTGLEETEAAMRLYSDLRKEIEAFDRAVRRRITESPRSEVARVP